MCGGGAYAIIRMFPVPRRVMSLSGSGGSDPPNDIDVVFAYLGGVIQNLSCSHIERCVY
jgi:hypothetical protein